MTTQTLSDFAELIRKGKEVKRLQEAEQAAEIMRESIKIQNNKTLEVHEKAVAASELLAGLMGVFGSSSEVVVAEPKLVPVEEEKVEIKVDASKRLKKPKTARKPEPEENKTEVDLAPKLTESTDIEPEVTDVSKYLTKDMLVEIAEPKVDVNALVAQMEQMRQMFEAKIRSLDSHISQVAWGGSGGGAARVSDLDDVDVRTQALVKDNILYYEPTKRKWLPKSIEQLAADLAPLIGGQLYTPYNRMIDETPQFIYIGESAPGVHVNQVGWRIKRIEQLAGGDMNVVWAAGSVDFSLIWDSRATYDYTVT
jgi:hypothetical protein